MQRFPSLRSEPRSAAGLAADVRVGDGRADGTLVWPYDAIFRPLIGFYVGGRLRALTRTSRQFRDGEWRCIFALDIPQDKKGVIACVETGDILWPEPELSGAVFSVENIVALGRRASTREVLDGFPSFLTLPLTDQITILYRDYLDRLPASDEIRFWRTLMAEGALSILDVRDELAIGEEVCAITIDDRRGALCLWGGFPDTIPHLVPHGTDGCARSAFDDINCDPADLIALTAIGGGQAPNTYMNWLRAHQASTNRIITKIARAKKEPQHPTRRYRTGNLLPVMKCGPGALRRDNGGVETSRASVVVHGPYLRVEAGHHKLELAISTEQSPAHLVLEIVHGDVLLSRQDLLLDNPGPHRRVVDFAVPKELMELIDVPKIEFRLINKNATQVAIESIRLCVHEGSADAAILNVQSLNTGDAGTRGAGNAISARREMGRVFYGPYCWLLPGQYQFSIDCCTDESGTIELDVVSNNAEVLLQRRMTLVPGTIKIEASFELPKVNRVTALAGPLEFRLWKAAGFTFTCTAGALRRMNGAC